MAAAGVPGQRTTSSYLGRFNIMPPFLQEPNITSVKPLDAVQMKAILAMIKDQPSLYMAINNFQDSVLVNPFDVIIGGDNTDSETVMSLKPEITNIISTFWMPWLRDLDHQTTAFGFAPFYFQYGKYQVPVEDGDDDDDENDDEHYSKSKQSIGYFGDPYIDSLQFEQRKRERTKEREAQEAETLETDQVIPLNINNRRSKPKLVKDILLYWPVSPKPEMGSVETFIHGKEQYLIWKWSSIMGEELGGKYDTKMYFIVEDMPSLETGQCTSRMASLVTHWQHLVNLRTQDLDIVKRIARPEHIIEYNPSGLSTTISPTNRAYIEGAHPSTHFSNITVGRPLSTPETTNGSDQGAINAGLDPMGQIINSTSSRNVNPQSQTIEALNLFMANHPEAASQMNFITKQIPGAHYLQAYQHYIPMAIPTHNITEKVMQLEEDFNRLASSVLSSPMELSMGSASSSRKPISGVVSGIESQQNFLHKRIRFRIKFFCGAVKQVFTLAFLNMFQQAKNDIQRLMYYHFENHRSIKDILELEKQLDFQVVFKPSATDMESAQIIEYYRHAIISEDEAFNMFFQKVGFTDPPVKAPADFKKRMQELYRKSPEEEAEIAASAKVSAKDKAGGGDKKRKAESKDKNKTPAKKPKK